MRACGFEGDFLENTSDETGCFGEYKEHLPPSLLSPFPACCLFPGLSCELVVFRLDYGILVLQDAMQPVP
jgi:hypothetical protein